MRNRSFVQSLETSPHLLTVVTPDSSLESLDGVIPIDIMSKINFSGRLMPRKKYKDVCPYQAFNKSTRSFSSEHGKSPSINV